MLRIEVKNYCPALKKLGRGPVIEFDPARQSKDWVICREGDEMPEAVILGDRMTQKIGDAEVSCEGCHLLRGGFKEKVKKKIA